MKPLGRRNFLKIGAAGSGLLAGGPNGKSNARPNEHHGHRTAMKEDHLDTPRKDILIRGFTGLIEMTDGLAFSPLPSERYPYPLTMLTHDTLPEPGVLRNDVKETMHDAPVGTLEKALALLELYACNRPGIEKMIPDDGRFFGECFNSKRLNGWIAVLGSADRKKLEETVNSRWRFRFFAESEPVADLYEFLNMLVRYAHVYGRTRYGSHHGADHFMDEQCPGEELDAHDMTHFIDEHCPGLLVCHGDMSDLELTLSLMAMKLGVPAIVPRDYPFPLGKTVRTDDPDEIAGYAVMFPNIRRLLDIPDIPSLPAYCDAGNRREKFKAAEVWGDTGDSFYLLRKGTVDEPGYSVTGEPGPAMGILVTVEGEPLDAFDRTYIESMIIRRLSMIRGCTVSHDDGRAVLKLSKDTEATPERIGEVLVAAVSHDFPVLRKTRVEIIFGSDELGKQASFVRGEMDARAREIASTTEESMDRFYSCTGCSPFAPNHMCVVTPERPPQCGRPFEMIKTGALYQYDDMSNIHHSIQQRTFNSFQHFEKGTCVDPVCGEWTGANEQIGRLTHGRTRRLLLHTLRENPHTGCGCFRLILFETDTPKKGVGVMGRSFKGACPDGRSWNDLHFMLGGKQTPGVAGAQPDYLFSDKFLQADGGWDAVVWVSPDIAERMGDRLPPSVEIG